ncbi:MAG: class I SAM-dependent methyltransferase [Cryomorphaceae bacterium]
MHDVGDTSKIARGFDQLAAVYDPIVHLVFGSSIALLQEQVIRSLPPSKHTLILGGGTGAVLRQCLDRSLALEYTYAEISSSMISKTKARLKRNEHQYIHFTSAPFSGVNQTFDLVIFPFVLDCLTTAEVNSTLLQTKTHLSANGQIVLFDFNQEHGTAYKKTVWKEVFIWLLYRFFRAFTHISAHRLPSFHSIMDDAGYTKCEEHYRYNGWVQATVWKTKENA